MRAIPRRLTDEAGASLVFTLIAIVGLLSVAALAIDVGVLVSARSDAQRAADAAALAGASALLESATRDEAEARAIDLAGRNAIFGGPILPEEVEVEVDEPGGIVRVVIRRPEITTFFASFLGVERTGVVAHAAAQVTDSPTATCAKPFSPPDPLLAEDAAAAPGKGKAKGQDDGGAGGREELEYGDPILLHGGKGSSEAVAWDVPLEGGFTGSCRYQANGSINSGPTLRANICNCNNSVIRLGEEYSLLNGQKTGPMNQGIDALLEQDAGAHWDEGTGRIVGSESANWRRGPRVVTIPLHDPASVRGGTVVFTRYITVFVEGGSHGSLNGRYMGSVRSLRLIE